MAARDFFSYDRIRDKDKEIVCIYVTCIGTIEDDGEIHMRTDLGEQKDQKMAFGRVTVCNQDRKISALLKETGSRVYRHVSDPELGTSDVISFTAKERHADEAYEFEPGDRVLVQGKAYIRKNNDDKYPGRLPELSITVSGLFRLGKARPVLKRVSMNASLIPQK